MDPVLAGHREHMATVGWAARTVKVPKSEA
jgi:hypothetical protein